MRALQGIRIVGAITFTGMIHQVAYTPSVAGPDTMQKVEVSAETLTSPALSAAVPEATAGPETAPPMASGPLVPAKAESATIRTRQNRWTWVNTMPPHRCRQRAMRPTMLP